MAVDTELQRSPNQAEMTVLADGFTQPVGLRVGASGTIYVAERSGRISSVDPATGDVTPLAMAPSAVSAWDLHPDESTAFVASGLTGLLRIPLDGSPGTKLANLQFPVGAVRCDQAGTAVRFAELRLDGRVLEIDLAAGGGTIVGRGLNLARGLVIDSATGRNLVAQRGGGGQLVVPATTGAPTILSTSLGDPADLAWRDSTQGRLLIAAAGRVLDASPTGAGSPGALVTGIADLWAAQPITAQRLAIGSGDSILIADLGEPAAPVVMTVPTGELFISGWTRVAVTINDPSIVMDDIDFHVKPDDSGALVSLSRDNGYDPDHPSVVLSAGWRTGEHELIAVRRSDGTPLGETTFEVLDTWTNTRLGPSLATMGDSSSGPDEGTWGGPDSGDFTVPQNVGVHKALGTRNIGVILVDTSSARYPTGAALNTIITDLRDQIITGVASGGQTRSVRRYYRHASDNRFDIRLVGIAGPINLPNAWGSYFTKSSGKWKYNESTDASVISAVVAANAVAAADGNPLVLDLSACDSIVYVVRSVIAPAGGTDRFAWPRASRSTKSHIIGTQILFGLTLPVSRPLARVFIPDDWEARDSRRLHETLSHELSHNLGLRDQYNKSYGADVVSRLTAQGNPRWSWEIMAYERNLPMPSAAHRLMLGWIDPEDVELLNFGVVGPVDTTITLQAASAGRPETGSGRKSAAEVRVEDGKNFYFEYRASTAGVTVDSSVPEASAVLGTEAVTRDPVPTDRAQILLVPEDDDADVEQGSFITAQDFRDKDTSSPGFENEFIVDVVSTTSDTAEVRFRYAADEKPDPGMTPWSPSTNWQSPDLKVSNSRSQADAAFTNVPWEGHDNTITATVRNNGTSDAHGVVVRFYTKDFTFGGGDEKFLGETKLDVPKGGAPKKFVCPKVWRPTTVSVPFGSISYRQHACVVARIEPFHDPVSGIWEVTPENNEAQSNYHWMASTTASPATREVTTIVAENPFDKEAVMSINVHQPHPLFRVYLDHQWVVLGPGEKKRILMMSESLLGDPRFEQMFRPYMDGERRIETTMRLSAYGDTGELCAADLVGGVSVKVMTGFATEFRRFEVDGHGVRGAIAESATGDPVNGPVVVTVRPPDPDDPRPELSVRANAVNGEFRTEFGDHRDGDIVQGHYLGQALWMPCDSEEVEA
jgi:M6 family metalloprotease-like protein